MAFAQLTFRESLRDVAAGFGVRMCAHGDDSRQRCQLSDEAASFELMYSFIVFGRAVDRTHDVVIPGSSLNAT
jgi:hypothetical protein